MIYVKLCAGGALQCFLHDCIGTVSTDSLDNRDNRTMDDKKLGWEMQVKWCQWYGVKEGFFYLSLLASHLLSASLCLINTHPHNELWLNAVHLLLVARETDRCFTGLWNYSLVWFLLRKNIFLCISFSLKIREKSLKSLFITKTSTIKDWVWNISQQVHDFVSKQERNFAICGIFIVVQKKGTAP